MPVVAIWLGKGEVCLGLEDFWTGGDPSSEDRGYLLDVLTCHGEGKSDGRKTVAVEACVGAVALEVRDNRSRREAFCCYSWLISALAAASSVCNCFTVGMFMSGVVDTFLNTTKIYRKSWKVERSFFHSFICLNIYFIYKLN